MHISSCSVAKDTLVIDGEAAACIIFGITVVYHLGLLWRGGIAKEMKCIERAAVMMQRRAELRSFRRPRELHSASKTATKVNEKTNGTLATFRPRSEGLSFRSLTNRTLHTKSTTNCNEKQDGTLANFQKCSERFLCMCSFVSLGTVAI